MKMLARAAIGLSALFACVLSAPAAYAQHATGSISYGGPVAPEESPITVPAISTPCTGTITSTAATSTAATQADPILAARFPACTASFASGVGKLGPFVPQLGRDLRVILKGTWTGTVSIGTSADGCATINPITVGGQPWGVYTTNANEVVDTPTLAGIGYCESATITSGSLTSSVRQ